jgi:hypothetical protein
MRFHISIIVLFGLLGACSKPPPLVYLSRQGVGSAEETQRYYAAMGSGDQSPAAPTLQKWFDARCFDPQIAAFYYNPTDLGLGREMRCGRCPEKNDPRGRDGLISCAVSNHGTPLGIAVKQSLDAKLQAGEVNSATLQNNLRNAAIADALNKVADYVTKHPAQQPPQVAQTAPFRGATVAMDYDPRLPENERVRFFIYDGEDPIALTAPNTQAAGLIPGLQLDNEGVKFIRNCLNCHGGAYDEQRDVIVGASFLDFNTRLLKFGAGVTSREQNEASLRALNELVRDTKPAKMIRERTEATLAGRELPESWAGSGESVSKLYKDVVDPYCATCHFSQRAESIELAQRLRDSFLRPNLDKQRPIDFATFAKWSNQELQDLIRQTVCQSSDMPHAEVTRLNLLADEEAFGILCRQAPAASIVGGAR